jgi:hypothetical protein
MDDPYLFVSSTFFGLGILLACIGLSVLVVSTVWACTGFPAFWRD